MPKIWVRIEYPNNPHPVAPYEAYKTIADAVADQHGFLDEMLFDMTEGSSFQYLLITTQTQQGFTNVIGALKGYNPEPEPLRLMTLGEVESDGSSAA